MRERDRETERHNDLSTHSFPSTNRFCDLCNHQYKFRPGMCYKCLFATTTTTTTTMNTGTTSPHPHVCGAVYSRHMPRRLPLGHIVRGVVLRLGSSLSHWLRYTVVAACWLIGLPLLSSMRMSECVASCCWHVC